MTQKTLFETEDIAIKTETEDIVIKTEIKEGKTEEKVKPEKVETETGEKGKYGYDQIKDKPCFNYYDITLTTATELDGTKKHTVSISHTSEQPKGFLGSSYGSGGEGFNPSDLKGTKTFFDNIMEYKKHRVERVYREFTDEEGKICYDHYSLYSSFRLIPANSFFVFISDKLVELMKKTGFDFEKWYKEYQSIPEKTATQEHWDKAQGILQLYEQGDKITKDLELLEKVEDAVKETGKSEYFNKTDEEIQNDIHELALKLYDVSQKINENESFLGDRGYSSPFGWELDHFGITEDGKKKAQQEIKIEV